MRLAFYSRSLKAARGAERVIVHISRGLAERGHEVDVLIEEDEGWLVESLKQAENGVRVVPLREAWPRAMVSRLAGLYVNAVNLITAILTVKNGQPSAVAALWRMTRLRKPPLCSLAGYVFHERPDVMISFLNYPNMALLMTTRLYRGQTRFVVNVRNHVSRSAGPGASPWMHSVPDLMRRLFSRADGVFAPSQGVAQDIAKITGLAASDVTVIYNPVYSAELRDLAKQRVEHPWLDGEGPPVMMASGKMMPQKDFPTLLRAFALVRSRRPVRLILLGNGPGQDEIVALAHQLGVFEDLYLPGHVDNPYAYYSRASVFVLSSRFEGLPNVLIEAMACGCPVVSTRCPSGPSEILAEGMYGRLVPVGDPGALAEAIEATLLDPPSKERLLERARFFSVENSVAAYEAAILNYIGQPHKERQISLGSG